MIKKIYDNRIFTLKMAYPMFVESLEILQQKLRLVPESRNCREFRVLALFSFRGTNGHIRKDLKVLLI